MRSGGLPWMPFCLRFWQWRWLSLFHRFGCIPRPFAVLQIRNFLKHAADSSFPSDHSTVLFALGFALWASGWVPGRSAGALAVVLGISVGWARVYLAAHYPLDIVGAAGVAAISSWAVASPMGRTISARLTIWGEHLFGWSIARNLRRRR